MPWQDLIIGIGSILFMIALIPTVISDNKPRYETALITAAVLYSFAATYITLDLWFAATTAALTATLWMRIAVEAYSQQKDNDWYHESRPIHNEPFASAAKDLRKTLKK